MEFQRIGLEPFTVLGTRVIPLRLWHGKFKVLGFRFGNVAYCTDTNRIPAESLESSRIPGRADSRWREGRDHTPRISVLTKRLLSLKS